MIRMVTKSNRLPISNFFRSAAFRLGKPIGLESLRSGPGPKPSSRRAMLKVVQGIPNQISRTLRSMINLKIRCSTAPSNKSSLGLRHVSIAKARKPRLRSSEVNLPHPAKISRMQGPGGSCQCCHKGLKGCMGQHDLPQPCHNPAHQSHALIAIVQSPRMKLC